MRTYAYRYPVKLSEEQRRFLETMVHMSRTPAKHYLVDPAADRSSAAGSTKGNR
jgi:hypothetical protein